MLVRDAIDAHHLTKKKKVPLRFSRTFSVAFLSVFSACAAACSSACFWCRNGALMVQRWCSNGTVMVQRWHCDGAAMAPWDSMRVCIAVSQYCRCSSLCCVCRSHHYAVKVWSGRCVKAGMHIHCWLYVPGHMQVRWLIQHQRCM